jgi:hypothetical protein
VVQPVPNYIKFNARKDVLSQCVMYAILLLRQRLELNVQVVERLHHGRNCKLIDDGFLFCEIKEKIM